MTKSTELILLTLFCLLVTISTETYCPCGQGKKYFVINSASLLSQKCFFLDTDNNGSGQYLLINATCINNSFAQVLWQTDPSSKIRIELVSIQYECHNISSNKLVS